MNPMCPTNDGIEDTEHFSLLCPSFDIQRQDLLAGVSELLRPFVQIETLRNNVLVQYLYGNKELSNDVNKMYWNVFQMSFIKQVGLDSLELSFYATQPPCTFCPLFFCRIMCSIL